MISSVRGVVLAALGTQVVVEVGGIGLAVTVTPQHALAVMVGAEASLHTALVVREDDLALYGFRVAEELTVFDLLRGVTGVGPKSAMGVLSAMTPDQISAAVSTEDDAAFRKVSGIGPKTAKLIVLQLAGKLHLARPVAAAPAISAAEATGDRVLAALVGLGWSERIAAQAVDDAVASATPEERGTVAALLRLALSQLGPRQRDEVTTQ